MICEACHGQRLVKRGGRMQPCEACGGSGVVHCCDGLSEQPDDCPEEAPAVAPGFDFDRAGNFGFTVRIVPSHPDLRTYAYLAKVAWAPS